jgi:hypothetical protein
MNENYIERDLSRNVKIPSNCMQESVDESNLFKQKRSGKQILNKLKENLSKNNLKTNHSLNSHDMPDCSKSMDEEKNLKNLTMYAISKSSSPIEIKKKELIPDVIDIKMKIEKKATSHPTEVKDEKTNNYTVKNFKNSKDAEQKKKKRGCLQFVLKCFSFK